MFTTFKRSALATVTLIFSVSATALAHGDGGVFHLASSQIAVGGQLVLTGEKFEKNADMTLVLRGTLDNYPIGHVLTGKDGRFSAELVLPPHVPAGSYVLVAIAADEDVAARADLTVGMPTGGPGSGPAAAMPGMPGMGTGTQEMPGEHATEEMMVLQHTTTPEQWAVIWALIIVAFGGGAVLLRRAAARPR